jgi:hypothetical protein
MNSNYLVGLLGADGSYKKIFNTNTDNRELSKQRAVANH